jgi:hypothetical protein
MTDRTFAAVIAVALVMLAAASRVVPHPWNFTPMIAVALFGGARIARPWLSVAAVLGCLALGDIAIGLFPYEGMAWVYGSMALVVVVGRLLRTCATAVATLVAALGAGAVFFIITNFAVFTGSTYPHTFRGLVACYTAALPFYRNQIAGDLLFTTVLFGAYAVAISLRTRRPLTLAAWPARTAE